MNSRADVLLDFGGTHTKAQLRSDSGVEREIVVPSVRIVEGPAGERTIDPAGFADHVRGIFKEISGNVKKVQRIAITGQMASFLIVDAEGHPLSPIVSWQDERSDQHFVGGISWTDVVQDLVTSHGLHSWDGVRPGLPLVSLPLVLKSIEICDGARYMSIIQFAALCLGDESNIAQLPMHSSDAAATGLYDPIGQRWDEEIATTIGIPPSLFPPVVDKYVPTLSRTNGQTLIYVPIGDFQAAIHGSRLTPDELFIHMATGGQVARLSSTLELSENVSYRDMFQVRPSLMEGWVAVTKTHLPAGRLLNSVVQLLDGAQPTSPWTELDLLVEHQTTLRAKFHGHTMTKFDVEGVPTGGFMVKDLVSAICIGVHDQYLAAAQLVKGNDKVKIVFSGGALAKLPCFRRRFIDLLHVTEHRTIASEDTSLLGLSLLLASIY